MADRLFPILVNESSLSAKDFEIYRFGKIEFQCISQIPDKGFYFSFLKETRELTLHQVGLKDKGLKVEFAHDIANYHNQKLTLKTDLLARALNLEQNKNICDLTMGLAQDSMKLAYLGARVTAIERHPIVMALVQNALVREGDTPCLEHFKIQFSEMGDFIQNISANAFDAFYLDPMFSHKRTALPKKDMQYLADLVEEAQDESYRPVMEKILGFKKRLVIKRPRQAGPLCELKPRHKIEGKMIRFDVY